MTVDLQLVIVKKDPGKVHKVDKKINNMHTISAQESFAC